MNKKKVSPLFTKIDIPPTVSFPVTKLHSDKFVPTQIHQSAILSPPTSPNNIILPSTVTKNTEMCIACIINYCSSLSSSTSGISNGPSFCPVYHLTVPSETPSLDDVRCHLLNKRSVCLYFCLCVCLCLRRFCHKNSFCY